MPSLEKFSSYLKFDVLSIGGTHITVSNILFFVISLLLTLTAIQANRRIFSRVQGKSEPEHAASLYVLQRFSHYLVIAVGVFLCLSTLGIDMTHLALVATALSVGLGFGLQSIFNNFFSGIIILLERSLKVGDFIELDGGISGTVQEINIRSTLVRTRNNIDILVPNSEFVNGRVTNWTLGDPTFRLQIPFGVAYGSDKELVRKAVLEAAKRVAFTIDLPDRRPDLWLVNFGESSLDFELVVWVDPKKNTRPGGMRSTYLWEIETSLKEHGIEIPFPQRDVHIKSAPADLR
jgi:potassium-dependent mechanosensitive channel